MKSLPYTRNPCILLPTVRWMVRRDMQEVLAIEEVSFTSPWTEVEFMRALRTSNNIGMVLELNDEVVGYCVYALHRLHLEIVNLAVRPDLRRIGCGQTLVRSIKDKVEMHSRRNAVVAVVWENNLSAQLFLKSQGFQATLPFVKRPYDDIDGDGYLFKWESPC